MRNFAIAVAVMAMLFGCRSGQTARFEQRKSIGITSTNVGDWTVPVFAISEGPSAVLFQSSDTSSVADVEGFATTTNSTRALGIYECEEVKSFRFKGTFLVASTNQVTNGGL